MHYNNFTIDYLSTIKSVLNIEANDHGEMVCIPEAISDACISELEKALNAIWDNSRSAIDIVRDKHDSTIQSGLFGLVDDLDNAIKIGYLLSDRVVLIDYIYSRIITRKNPESIDRIYLCNICNSLVRLLPLAKDGRIVIIPNPFDWNKTSKELILEASKKNIISIQIISMLNMLSICKECKLNPYTIAESEELFDKILNDQIDYTDMIGKAYGTNSYESILCALLSEKLLSNIEFQFLNHYPIEKYSDIISQEKGFYSEYSSKITSGGISHFEQNIKDIEKTFLVAIEKKNNNISNIAKGISALSGVGGAGIALLGATSVISAPLAMAGASLSLIASLGAVVKSTPDKDEPLINVFKKLRSNRYT